MKFRRRQQRLLALIALLGLLFQQVAMALYVCPMEQQMAASEASNSPPCHPKGSADSARCQTHCHPLQVSC